MLSLPHLAESDSGKEAVQSTASKECALPVGLWSGEEWDSLWLLSGCPPLGIKMLTEGEETALLPRAVLKQAGWFHCSGRSLSLDILESTYLD